MDKIKSVIFDIDGTLTDSLWVWTESDRILLERRGIKYTEDVSFALKSMHFTAAAEYLRGRFSMKETAEEIGAEITEIVRDMCFTRVRLMPYVKEFLDILDEKGVRYCAATSNSRELAEGMLRNNGIYGRMSFLITSDEAGSGKDSPDIFRICCERLGTEPSASMVIEDSPHAAKTAKDAGFFTVGVNSGHFGDFEMLSDCTDIRTEDLSGIIKIADEIF